MTKDQAINYKFKLTKKYLHIRLRLPESDNFIFMKTKKSEIVHVGYHDEDKKLIIFTSRDKEVAVENVSWSEYQAIDEWTERDHPTEDIQEKFIPCEEE